MTRRFIFPLLLTAALLFTSLCFATAKIVPPPHLFGMFPGNGMTWTPLQKADATKQNWDHYCPPCKLSSKTLCRLPCQTHNQLKNGVYDGINVVSDQWMKLANQAALVSVQHGGGPFAAVILQIDDKTNKIIRYWVNHNQVVLNHDPTDHGEIATIRLAAKDLGVVDLGHINKKDSKLQQPGEWSHCIIYSSAEPCPMCMSAIYWAGIHQLYFAATRFDSEAKGLNFSDAMIYKELKKTYALREHMQVRHVITNNSLDAFNYFKRNNVPRYGQNEKAKVYNR